MTFNLAKLSTGCNLKYYLRKFIISHPHVDFLPTRSFIIAVNLTFLFIIHPVIAKQYLV